MTPPGGAGINNPTKDSRWKYHGSSVEESTLWTQEGSPGEEAELRLKEQVGFGETEETGGQG